MFVLHITIGFRSICEIKSVTISLKNRYIIVKVNALYTSWKIQDDIVDLSNSLILDALVAKINSLLYLSSS